MFRKLVKVLALCVLLVAVAAGGLYTWSHVSVNTRLQHAWSIAPAELDFAAADVELGRRIVQIRNGCIDCHGGDLGGAPVVEDPAFAIVHGPNLTPAALGSWSDAEILRAVRHGVGRDGRALVLMPSHEYQHLSEGDLAAVVAYLRRVPRVDRPNGPVKLGPIATVLVALGRLPTVLPAEIVDHAAAFAGKPGEAPTADFGRYLVQSACTGCHGPELRGGPIPGGPPEWPPASDISRATAGAWTHEQFVRMMRSGVGSAGEPMRLPMPIALTSQLDDVELEAMWRYLSGH